MRDDRAEAQCSPPSGSPLVAIDAQRSPSPFPALHPASSSLSATPGRKAGLNAKAAVTILLCEGGKVKSNHAAKTTKELNVDSVIKDLKKILN